MEFKSTKKRNTLGKMGKSLSIKRRGRNWVPHDPRIQFGSTGKAVMEVSSIPRLSGSPGLEGKIL